MSANAHVAIAGADLRRTDALADRLARASPPLARYARDLAAHHALRGDDAIHLACALELHGDGILLATSDNAQRGRTRDRPLLANDTG